VSNFALNVAARQAVELLSMT